MGRGFPADEYVGPECVHVPMEGRGGQAGVENCTLVVRALVLWVVELELLFENVDMRTSNCLKCGKNDKTK
jgi:hypothetical protein